MGISFFISSSTERLAVAKAIEANLAAEGYEPTLWSREAHGASEYNLEALAIAARTTDFGVFVLAPDDTLIRRGKTFGTVRDNVLFELGLFIGLLGRERCFILKCTDEPMELPSDLDGLTQLPYSTARADGNMRRALGPTSTSVAERALQIALAGESLFSNNDLRLLSCCTNPSMPSNQAFKAFGSAPKQWDDALCMRFMRLREQGLLAAVGTTELASTRRGQLLAASSKRTTPDA